MRLDEQVISKDELAFEDVYFDKEQKVSLKLKFMDKTELEAIFSRNTKTKFNSKTHQPEEKTNSDAVTEEICKDYVNGWNGFTWKFLSSHLPVKLPPGAKWEDQIEFNQANLKFIVNRIYGFNTWLLDAVKDASNFARDKEAETKN